MDLKKLAKILDVVGILAIIGALVWFLSTFGDMPFNAQVASCIYSTGGICEVASTLRCGYTPILLWLGVACIIAGVVIMTARKK